MYAGPYLLYLGEKRSAKVAEGMRYWRPDQCLGQFRDSAAALDLDLPDMTPEEAAAGGAKAMIIGVANRGGRFSKKWLPSLERALAAGLDLASGLHELLTDQPSLVAAAKRHGRNLIDIRVHRGRYPLGTGAARPGKRCLAVGTDSSVGKMFAMLALEREFHRRGLKATFRATGQTGMFIAGGGVPLDALIGDFMSGAVEELTPANDPDHWDLVEGQGSLYHPSYANLTTALLHGARPDALILCHEPTRKNVRGLPDVPPPSIEDMGALSLAIARVVNPDCVIAGVSLNTKKLKSAEARALARETEARLGLPAVDPLRHGAEPLVDALLAL